MKKHSNKKYTKEEWVEKMVAIHGNKYGYERVVYLGAHIKVEIFCKECGIYFFKNLINMPGEVDALYVKRKPHLK